MNRTTCKGMTYHARKMASFLGFHFLRRHLAFRKYVRSYRKTDRARTISISQEPVFLLRCGHKLFERGDSMSEHTWLEMISLRTGFLLQCGHKWFKRGDSMSKQTSELDKTTFCETETRPRLVLVEISRLRTRPRPGLIEISRPRRYHDFCKMIFRDRDETETSIMWFSETKTRPRREISAISHPFRDRDENYLKTFANQLYWYSIVGIASKSLEVFLA